MLRLRGHIQPLGGGRHGLCRAELLKRRQESRQKIREAIREYRAMVGNYFGRNLENPVWRAIPRFEIAHQAILDAPIGIAAISGSVGRKRDRRWNVVFVALQTGSA